MLTTTPPATYAELVAALDEGLAAVRDTFAGLDEAEWTRSTLLEPLDPALRPWTDGGCIGRRSPR